MMKIFLKMLLKRVCTPGSVFDISIREELKFLSLFLFFLFHRFKNTKRA